MTQFDYGNIDESTTSGTDLGSLLEQSRDANHSLQKGTARPTYAVPGMLWINDISAPWVLNLYNGVNDLKLAEIDVITHEITLFNKGLALGNIATSGDYSDLANTPSTGLDKFFKSPQIDVPADGVGIFVAHNLGVIPNLVKVTIECITPDNTFFPGDVVELVSDRQASLSNNRSIAYNSTNIDFVRSGDRIADRNGDSFTWTSSRWKLVFRAWS